MTDTTGTSATSQDKGMEVRDQDSHGHQQMARRGMDHPFGDLFASPFGASPFGDLFGVNRLFSLLDTLPAVQPRVQSARWGIESIDRLEDGSQVVSLNLAGWKKDEVSVTLDTALNRLTINASRASDSENSHERRNFTTSISVPPGTKQDHLKVAHEDGVLSVTVAPTGDQEENIINIPVQ